MRANTQRRYALTANMGKIEYERFSQRVVDILPTNVRLQRKMAGDVWAVYTGRLDQWQRGYLSGLVAMFRLVDDTNTGERADDYYS